jgi:serine/threonine protein kinase
MRHPNIVLIYDVGEHEGRAYFAMELVEGGSLHRHLGGRPQPPDRTAGLVRTLALAVQHAHAQKVVHRDLKPANVLLTGDGIPKVADFGLAKRLDSESTALTQDGAVLGTASYMAPEQAAGRVGAIGPAADIYALGAILYEMLTGRPPFRGSSWNDTVRQVLEDEPEPPGRLHPDVPRDLETICLKCLEKEPERRYASASELAADLGRFLAGNPVAAVPLGESERLARLAARDGYQIDGEVGRGPRSTVYHARYGPLKQVVAVKLFRTGCTREAWEAHLQRSAPLWATLAHPHVVPVQRAGWWDGAPYLALEYMPQGSLAARLAGHPYSVRAALGLVEQLAETVRYLHRQGVVHGNLKPSNVLLAADGIARVADFRPAACLAQCPLPQGDAEPSGLAYLAPELIANPEAEPRPYTDVYGLGLILYELLTGRAAFSGLTAAEALSQVRTVDPVPPSQLNAWVTPQLEAFCLRCLRKDPWRRYRRVYDLSRQLQWFQAEPDAPAGTGHPSTRPAPDRTDAPRMS